MELNHMAPTPIPPLLDTDEDDPPGLEVADIALDGVTLLICLCGLLGNGTVLWLLGFRIRRNPITVYILNLAAADSAFLIFTAASAILCIVDSIFHSDNEHLRLLFLLSLFSYNMGLYLLAAISIERCVSVLCSNVPRPRHLSAVVCALLWALSVLVIATVTSLCQWHQHEHCRRAVISMYLLNFLVFAPPMVLSNVILFIKVLCGSQQRQTKRLYIVIFLSILFFLLLALPLSIWNFSQQFSYIHVKSQYFFLLACINSSINPFIYFLVGSCRRHCCSLVSLQVAFRRVFEEPKDLSACSNNTTMGTLASAC